MYEIIRCDKCRQEFEAGPELASYQCPYCQVKYHVPMKMEQPEFKAMMDKLAEKYGQKPNNKMGKNNPGK
jgi:DNA-directed RNA polymerase subunit RPC12/RpoP